MRPWPDTVRRLLPSPTRPPVMTHVLVDHGERFVARARLHPHGDVVVKFDADRARLLGEADTMRDLVKAGLPVPEILHRCADASGACLVTPFVEAEELSSRSDDARWSAVGAVLRRVHDRLPVRGRAPFWPGMHEVVRGLLADELRARLPRATRARLTRLVRDVEEAPTPRPVGLHGDAGPYHFLLRDLEVAAILDVADSGVGDPAWDIATLTLWDRDRLDAVLDGYAADATLTAHVRRHYEGLVVLRHVAAFGWLVEHDVDPSPTVAELARLGGG